MEVIVKYKGCLISEEEFKKYFKSFQNKGNPFYLLPVHNLEDKMVTKMAKLYTIAIENNSVTLEFI